MTTFALVYAALALIAAGSARHGPAVRGRPQGAPGGAPWRLAGWLVVLVSLVPPMAGPGWRIALVTWFGLLAAAALLVTLMLVVRARLVRGSAFLLLVAAGARLLARTALS